jgi:Uma2 family endonuclease
MTQTIAPHEYAAGTPRRYDWTVDQYHQMGELGLFAAESRYELVDGEVYQHVSPAGLRHSVAFENALEALAGVFAADFRVLPERPLRISEISELQPDVLVVRGNRNTFSKRHPEPSDVALVVEVSDATLSYDRGRKCSIYANAGIPEYWIINLVDNRLEVFRDPVPDIGFRTNLLILPTQTIAPLSAEDRHIAVSDLLAAIL